MTELLQLDQEIFHIINDQWHNSFLDAILPYWRDKKFWIPFYLLLTAFLAYQFKIKALYFVLAVALTIGIADTTSSKLIKKSVQRLRPCNDPALKSDVNLLVGCGGGYSFTSSHATNHFAMALFFFLTLGRLYRWTRIPFLFWAASIAFGQVYVGVHYPLDVLVGSIIGSLIGIIIGKLYLRQKKISIAA